MKNIQLPFLILALVSCNPFTKEVDSSFSTTGITLDSLNKIEEKKIQNYFNEINQRLIKKFDGDNFQ